MFQSSSRRRWEALKLEVFIAALNFFGCAVIGTVMAALWQWFVLPLWPQAPHLDLKFAIGLSLLVGLLTQSDSSDPDDLDTMVNKAASNVRIPLTIFVIGLVIHLL